MLHDECTQSIHHTDKYSQHSIIWPVWLSGWFFVNKLSGCWFESCLNLSLFIESYDDVIYYVNVNIKKITTKGTPTRCIDLTEEKILKNYIRLV